jgi:uncharacterized membrane protein YoaK (UPF0700 family)
MVGAIGGMTHESMTAMMRAMLVLAAPACIVVTAMAVLAYRRWKDDKDSV